MTTYERFSEEARADRKKRNKKEKQSYKKGQDIYSKRICFCFKWRRNGQQSFETDKHSTADTNRKRLLDDFEGDITEEEKLTKDNVSSAQNPRNTTTHQISDSSEISIKGSSKH